MNAAKKAVVLTGALVAFQEVAAAAGDTRHFLVPSDHVHPEMYNESVATTSTYSAASGNQAAFDNEKFSPALPWARWWQADENLMAAAQRMLRLGDAY